MKRIVFLLAIMSAVSFGQFKEQISKSPRISDGMIKSNTSSMILGFINADNFKMQHSYNLSYTASGKNGLALGMYTNSMSYNFSNRLNVQLDASLIHTPYSTYGRELADQINGFYISKAQLNYEPFDNFKVMVQYSNNPYRYYSRFSNYYSPFYGSDSWFDDFDK